MHSLKAPFFTFAAALSLVTSLSAASSQAKSTPDKPAGVIEHKVAKGETLWSISQKHQTSVGDIMTHNKLDSNNVREGMILKIPPRAAVTPSTNAPAVSRPSSTRESIHVVKNGETFWSIAEKYKINPQALAEANPNLNPNRLHRDMEVVVPAAKLSSPAQKTNPVATTKPQPQPSKPAQNTPAPAPANTFQHSLVQGETFYSLGKKYSVKLADIVSANTHLNPNRLAPGTKVNIPGKAPANVAANTPAPASATKPEVKPAHAPAPTPALTMVKHTVKNGDSIANIANRYAVSPEALLKANNLKAGEPIYIDDVLTIPTNKKPAVSDTNNTSTTPSVETGTSQPQPQQQQQVATNTTPIPAPAPSPAPAPAESPAPASTPAPTPEAEKEITKQESIVAEHNVNNPADKPSKITEKEEGIDVGADGSIMSYTISYGETEETICEAFGITKKELFDHNKLGQGAKLRPGDEIMIPPTTKKIVAR